MELFEWLTAPLSYGFMQRALQAAILVGIICPVIGSFMVLKGLSFFGDALSHAILPGVVITYLLQLPLLVGALLSAIVATVTIGFISRRSDVKEDTAIGIVFAGAFALGVALLSTVRSYAVDLTHILFGDVLGVAQADIWLMLGLGVLVLGTVLLFYKELLVVTFDPMLAVVLRLPAGIALVLATLVTPAAAAQLLTRRLPTMMAVAALLGVSANVTGLYLSYYANIASGPAMVLVSTFFFLMIFLFAPARGMIWRRAYAQAR
jgi:ABC-type Mn2+/Zn2+ transport system permease subunit